MGNSGLTTAIIGFEQQVWKAADILRGIVDASDLMNAIVSLSMKVAVLRKTLTITQRKTFSLCHNPHDGA
jgi:hypothetical protein